MNPSETPTVPWRDGIGIANGIAIHYLRSGGDLPPLIALHGLLGSGACLVPLTRTLTNAFDIVLPDARGHGQSAAPAAGYLYRHLADDVIGLIATLRLQAPVLMGHSMGGMTAAVAASELGNAIAGVVLIDPTFISPQWQREVFESGVAEEHRQALASPRTELLAQAGARNPQRAAELLEYLVDARLRTSTAAFEVLTPPNPDYRELVRRIQVPILLAIGDDGVVSLATARELQALNPLLRYESIDGAGHGVPYDQPERLGATIKIFLDSLPGRATR